MQIIITRANAIIACELITIIRMCLFVLKGKVNCLAGFKEKSNNNKSVAAIIQSYIKLWQEIYSLHKVKIFFSKAIIFSNMLLGIKYLKKRRKRSIYTSPMNDIE